MLLNELPIHLLALLSVHKKATGYDLAKIMSESRLWRASHQQIYRSLNKMADDGFLMFKDDPQEGKPDRKVYSLTAEGIAKFNEAVESATPSMKSLHSMRTIMLNVGNQKYFEELLAQLRAAIEETEQLLEETDNPSERIAMQREIYINRAEESYCVDALAYLKNHKCLAA
ncbi:PadR family transcriptional regulator [Vibrio parahaemolyticus]